MSGSVVGAVNSQLPTRIYDAGGNAIYGYNTSNDANGNVWGVPVLGFEQLFNGATWDRQRTPKVFTRVPLTAVTAGVALTVWTPAGGKKFRLMGFALSLSVAGHMHMLDSATTILSTPAMPASDGSSGPFVLGNGILSVAANNPLKVDVSANGSVVGFVFGTEE